MASLRTLLPVLLLAFALVAAGGLMEGVRGAPGASSSVSSIRRRLAGHPMGAGAATAGTNCKIKCGGIFPTCCRFSPPFQSFFFCAATGTDFYNCGSCGNTCIPGSICCDGVCKNPFQMSSDGHNCGICGLKCGPKQTCRRGMCSYTG